MTEDRSDHAVSQPIREELRALPNWGKGLGILVAMFFLLSVVLAVAVAKDAGQAIEIVYKAGLIATGLIGFPLLVWAQITGHKQARAALGQLQAKEQADLADRLERGARMLADNDPALRAAGRATLKQVGLEPSGRFSLEAGEVLASFIIKRSETSEVGDLERDRAFDALLAIASHARHAVPKVAFEVLLPGHQAIKKTFARQDLRILLEGVTYDQCQFLICDISVRGHRYTHCGFVGGTLVFSGQIGPGAFEFCRFSSRFEGVLDAAYFGYGNTFEGCDVSDCHIRGTIDFEFGAFFYDDSPPDCSERALRSLRAIPAGERRARSLRQRAQAEGIAREILRV